MFRKIYIFKHLEFLFPDKSYYFTPNIDNKVIILPREMIINLSGIISNISTNITKFKKMTNLQKDMKQVKWHCWTYKLFGIYRNQLRQKDETYADKKMCRLSNKRTLHLREKDNATGYSVKPVRSVCPPNGMCP